MDALSTALSDSWIAAASRDELASALRMFLQQQPARATSAIRLVQAGAGAPAPKSLREEN